MPYTASARAAQWASLSIQTGSCRQSATNRSSSTCIHSAASDKGGLTRVPSPMRGPVMLRPTPNTCCRSTPAVRSSASTKAGRRARTTASVSGKAVSWRMPRTWPAKSISTTAKPSTITDTPTLYAYPGTRLTCALGWPRPRRNEGRSCSRPCATSGSTMPLMPGTLSPLARGRSARSNCPALRIRSSSRRSLDPAACPSLRRR